MADEDIQQKADQLRARWQSLEGKLKTIKLAEASSITPKQWRAMASLLADRRNVAKHNQLHELLPLVAGEFKKAAQKTLMNYARANKGGNAKIWWLTELFYNRTKAAIGKDLDEIALLFKPENSQDRYYELAAGIFSEARLQSKLHHDTDSSQSSLLLVGRVGALPFKYMKGSDDARPELQGLIETAAKPEGQMARNELEDRGMLHTAPLGKLLLMSFGSETRGKRGILHCASAVKEPTPSAFCRYTLG